MIRVGVAPRAVLLLLGLEKAQPLVDGELDFIAEREFPWVARDGIFGGEKRGRQQGGGTARPCLLVIVRLQWTSRHVTVTVPLAAAYMG